MNVIRRLPHDVTQVIDGFHDVFFVFFAFSCGYFKSFLLSKITPTIATSNSTETTSKGSTYCLNKSWPSSAVPPSSVSDAEPFGCVARKHFRVITMMEPTEISP